MDFFIVSVIIEIQDDKEYKESGTDWMKLLENGGRWYKGNTHMHTTMSDGQLETEDAISLYRSAGYDFIALTDHRYMNEPRTFDDFLVLSGAEYDTIVRGDAAEIFHIVGIGMREDPEVVYGHESGSRWPKPQAVIDAIRRAGGEAILAHPNWSVMNPDDLYPLKGLAGVEIYNTVSAMPKNPDRADSSVYIDIWAKRGRFMNCIAADDAHGYNGDETRSFIRVNAPELTREAILSAVARGHFYASQGPAFFDLELENGVITAEVSGDVRTAVLATNTPWSEESVKRLPGSDGGQRVAFSLQETDTFARVFLIDENGRRAWCSPFAVR